ncbi:MAG: hypothetical protein PHE15_05015 [Dehalococcoidales bacterium]|nr:hypothetical protein [Dehalococcoidales bacterium]
MKRVSIFLFMILILAGCATAYQRKSLTGGYSETRLGENIFQISFKGNGYTSRERASDFSLLRSAEVALENEFRYFVIVDSERHTDIGAYTTPSTSHTTGNAYSYGNYTSGAARTTTYGGQTYYFSKPETSNTILCFKKKPDINGIIYDAEFVANSIKTKYGIGKSK